MVITPHRVGRARCTASSMEPLSGKESGCFFSRMWHGRLQACRSGLKRTSMKDHPTVLVSEVLCNQVHSGIYRLRFHPGLPPKKPQGINGGHTSTRNPLSVGIALPRRCCRHFCSFLQRNCTERPSTGFFPWYAGRLAREFVAFHTRGLLFQA